MRWQAWPVTCLVCGALAFSHDAASAASASVDKEPLDLETILGTTVDKEGYVEVTRCISAHKIREVKVLDEKHVAFRVGSDKYYLVQMTQRCPGLERDSKISYESSGSRVCTTDSIRGVIEFGTSAMLGPACRIPGFQEITRDQMVLIRDTLRNRK